MIIRRSGRDHSLSAVEHLRDLVLRLSERWGENCTFKHEPEVPWTNNLTEQAIGRMKMRARSVRGYKTWAGMQTGLLPAGTNSKSSPHRKGLLHLLIFHIRPPCM